MATRATPRPPRRPRPSGAGFALCRHLHRSELRDTLLGAPAVRGGLSASGTWEGNLGGKVYINGRIYPKEEATISVLDHGLLYGDGVFEGIRAYGGRPFRLDAHLQRLYESARAIALEIPISLPEMEQAVRPDHGGHRRAGHLPAPDRHARRRRPGPRPLQVQGPAGHHHRGRDRAVSRGTLRARAGDGHRPHRAHPRRTP